MSDGVAITAGSGTTIATDDAGASGHVQLVKLAISTDGSATALTADNTNGMLVNLGTNNDVTVSTFVTTDAASSGTEVGPAQMAIRDDALSTITPADGDWAPLRVDANGAQWVQLAGALSASTDGVYLGASATGGATGLRNLDIDESEDDVKTSAGKLYGFTITNLHTATVYVKFFNATAASVTYGSTTPYLVYAIPASTGLTKDLAAGIDFSTAISVGASLGVADADATAIPSANLVVGTIDYK